MGIRVFSGGGGGTSFTGGSIDTALTFTPDNTIDVGSASLRPRSVYAGTSVISPLYDRPEPTATTGASQAGLPISITASDAVASTDTAGAAAGGSVTITAGAAARNTSGNANGGNITLTPGAGIGTGISGKVIIPAGSNAAPSLVIGAGMLTGFSSPSTDVLQFSGNNGSLPAWISNYRNFTFDSAYLVGWSSSNAAANAADTGLARNAAGVIRATDGSTGIKGFLGGGASVASATALPVPTGRVFHVSGTTTITSITSTNFQSGAVITLIFDGVLTFTDGSNLKLAGDFVTTADDTITLAYDGTNWYEVCRSVN